MKLLSFLIIALSRTLLQASNDCRVRFHPVTGLSCVRSEFVRTHWEANTLTACSMLCANIVHCQAFSMSDCPCQLFVFHRCSKNVRDCSCSRTAQLFVRQQSGLPPGALCPAGYADDLCGTKYKFVSCVGNWTRCKEMCDAESGLVIMADVMDGAEMDRIGQLVVDKLASMSGFLSIYMGGWQLPGSSEPSGGWQWASCGLNISAALWGSGEPNDFGNGEDRAGVDSQQKFLDFPTDRYSNAGGGFCECVSPFE